MGVFVCLFLLYSFVKTFFSVQKYCTKIFPMPGYIFWFCMCMCGCICAWIHTFSCIFVVVGERPEYLWVSSLNKHLLHFKHAFHFLYLQVEIVAYHNKKRYLQFLYTFCNSFVSTLCGSWFSCDFGLHYFNFFQNSCLVVFCRAYFQVTNMYKAHFLEMISGKD